MSAISELTSLLWWLMLLSAAGIILHDIGAGILPAPRAKPAIPKARSSTPKEGELEMLEVRIRRALQRPSSFRTFQNEVARSIVQAALATKGLAMSRVPESRPELYNEILMDPALAQFVAERLAGLNAGGATPRGKMLAELERTILILEKAETELK